jgi:Domain of unknown function (DUF4158)
MGRRDLLSNEERALLFGIPETREGLINHYTLSRSDMDMIMSRRQPTTRLGFALQLSLLRHPGSGMAGQTDFEQLVGCLAERLASAPSALASHGRRPQIVSEHLIILMAHFCLRVASESELPMMISAAEEAALATDLYHPAMRLTQFRDSQNAKSLTLCPPFGGHVDGCGDRITGRL